jgi:DNA replication protein DnaC
MSTDIQDPPPAEAPPADAAPARAPVLPRIAVGFETRAGTCPKCGATSTETRMQYERADEDIPWTRHKCGVCVDNETLAGKRGVVDVDREAIIATRLKQLEVPEYYATATLGSFDVNGADPAQRPRLERVKQAAVEFLTDWPDVPMITLFRGVPGTGKGHIAWSLARGFVTQLDATARVCVLSDLIRDLRESWSRDEGALSESQRLLRYRSVDLLVIDEVSRHAFYGQPQQHLYDLVAWREIRHKPTILTTNDTGEDLAQVLGPALTSRLAGWASVWLFGEDKNPEIAASYDYRLKLAKARKRARVA